MMGLAKRRQNILRLIKRQRIQLAKLELDQRSSDEVFLWLMAYSVSLEKDKRDILGLWYGFGSLYQIATSECPGAALRGYQICELLGGRFSLAKFVMIRDQVILKFTIHLHDQAPSCVVDGIYYYQFEPTMIPVRRSRKCGIKNKNSAPKSIGVQQFFTWPAK